LFSFNTYLLLNIFKLPMMYWVRSGNNFRWFGWVKLGAKILDWVGFGFKKSAPWRTLESHSLFLRKGRNLTSRQSAAVRRALADVYVNYGSGHRRGDAPCQRPGRGHVWAEGKTGRDSRVSCDTVARVDLCEVLRGRDDTSLWSGPANVRRDKVSVAVTSV